MQDMESDLLNFDAFFGANNDEDGTDLWDLAAMTGHDPDLLDASEFEPLSPIKEPQQEIKQVQVKQEPGNRHGLKLDTNMINNSKDGTWAAQYEAAKSNGTPTAALPARFALLSTTCVFEPGFTTSPRGKRRISQTINPTFEAPEDEVEAENGDADADDEPFSLSGDEDYTMPEFTDAELNAMVESPSKLSTASTTSPTPSPSRGPTDVRQRRNSLLSEISWPTDPTHVTDQTIPNVINLFNSIYDSSQNFLAAQQQPFANANALAAATQAMFPNPFLVPPTAAPFDYFSPSGYAAAANQFLDSYGQQVQPFFLNPEAFAPMPKTSVFPGQFAQVQAQTTTNVQLAAAMAMANSAAAMNMRKVNGTYGVPIAPMQRRAGSMPPNTQTKVAAPLKPRLPVQRATSATSASGKARLAITPDIADFKLVQIFHQFCDPAAKVLTSLRFQQLLLHHQVKEETSSTSSESSDGTCCSSDSSTSTVVTPDAQALFEALDINAVGVLDLERFMHSFQICNRCTEAKRRAHQALCASQGQTFTPTALERQLMEDVAPVVVRVVPTRFEGHKVKSCEHYQWTWCEGFDKTGNEKCLGTNRHDKCPKYLANCTLWKHKLPPKSRKPKLVMENVDSPTKKLKHFS